MRDRPTFEAGTFSVAELKDLATQKECTSLPEGEYLDERRKSVTVILNGASFAQFELGEGMMSQGLDKSPPHYGPKRILRFSGGDSRSKWARFKQIWRHHRGA